MSDQVARVTNPEELQLALACVNGDVNARQTFLVTMSKAIKQSIGAVVREAGAIDDLYQDVVIALFDGDKESKPRLASYAGKGSLEGWVRVVVTREALRRAKKVVASGNRVDVESARLAASDTSPEFGALLRQSAPILVESIRDVLKELDSADRLLLKLSIIDGVSIDRLAALHGYHRATAARKVAALRERVLDGTRARVAARLQISIHEVDSFIRTAREAVDSSFATALSSES